MNRDSPSTRTLTAVLAPPLALLLVPLAKILNFPALLLDGIRIWIHEFGHAFVAWFSSRAATPLGIGWTSAELEPSAFVFICFAFLLGVVAWKGYANRSYFLIALALLAFTLQIRFTFFVSSFRFGRAFAWGGIGGEFYLSTILVLAFFYRLPDRLRWDFFRYVFLVIGIYALATTYYQWIQISKHEAMIPWGTMLHGEGDAGGDMNRLYDEYGLRREEIISSYLNAGLTCSFVIALQYIFYIVRFFTKPEPLLTPQRRSS